MMINWASRVPVGAAIGTLLVCQLGIITHPLRRPDKTLERNETEQHLQISQDPGNFAVYCEAANVWPNSTAVCDYIKSASVKKSFRRSFTIAYLRMLGVKLRRESKANRLIRHLIGNERIPHGELLNSVVVLTSDDVHFGPWPWKGNCVLARLSSPLFTQFEFGVFVVLRFPQLPERPVLIQLSDDWNSPQAKLHSPELIDLYVIDRK